MMREALGSTPTCLNWAWWHWAPQGSGVGQELKVTLSYIKSGHGLSFLRSCLKHTKSKSAAAVSVTLGALRTVWSPQIL